MLGWFRLIVAALLGVVAILFAFVNQTELSVTLPGGWVLGDVPLFVVVFVPLFLGFVLGSLSGWSGEVRQRRGMERLRDQNRALERELANLRTLPLIND
ncbi:hypothetical protein SIID45300_00280 [Candidatus Magnetaquicoccaceae bacterium FCR-1]|uniref:Lipopolysaccharide assembly protein A domain-containing protein n=1 Tax=Candidatus Magnetaquiglobus chichijimensis TaxID=3141448 RepID=A0ABQ0C518_9PROT